MMSKSGGVTTVGGLAEAERLIESAFGAEALVCLDGQAAKAVEVIPTGALSLDLALGIGGYPRGRIVEIYGPESSGKTTMTYHAIAAAQRLGGRCAFVDAEHSMDPNYAWAIGVDTTSLLLSQPDHGEQGLEIVDLLVRSGDVALVVVDSVAALTPKAGLDGAMGEQTVGLQARMMGQAMRKLAGHVREAGATVLFTNQLRERVGVVYGPKETQPGGRALKFYASQRLDIRRIETLKEGEEDSSKARRSPPSPRTCSPVTKAVTSTRTDGL
jgi:recombination protein RecA